MFFLDVCPDDTFDFNEDDFNSSLIEKSSRTCDLEVVKALLERGAWRGVGGRWGGGGVLPLHQLAALHTPPVRTHAIQLVLVYDRVEGYRMDPKNIRRWGDGRGASPAKVSMSRVESCSYAWSLDGDTRGYLARSSLLFISLLEPSENRVLLLIHMYITLILYIALLPVLNLNENVNH